MFSLLLLKLFVPGADREMTPELRVRCGIVSGITGIACNLLLAAVKLILAALSGSISIAADTEQKEPLPASVKKQKTISASQNPKMENKTALPRSVTQQKEKMQSMPAKSGASEEVLASLNETQRHVYEAIPQDRAISTDKLMAALGYKVSDLIAATTVLEIKGLINSLPGSLFIRK